MNWNHQSSNVSKSSSSVSFLGGWIFATDIVTTGGGWMDLEGLGSFGWSLSWQHQLRAGDCWGAGTENRSSDQRWWVFFGSRAKHWPVVEGVGSWRSLHHASYFWHVYYDLSLGRNQICNRRKMSAGAPRVSLSPSIFQIWSRDNKTIKTTSIWK